MTRALATQVLMFCFRVPVVIYESIALYEYLEESGQYDGSCIMINITVLHICFFCTCAIFDTYYLTLYLSITGLLR